MVVVPRTLQWRFPHNPKPMNPLRESLSSETISWALQNSYALDDFKAFFAKHGADDVEKAINGSVNGLQPIFTAIECNNPKTLRLLIESGGDPNVRGPSDAPLLTSLLSLLLSIVPRSGTKPIVWAKGAISGS